MDPLTPIETQLKALATVYQALQDAIIALDNGDGAGWNRDQDKLAGMAQKIFDMDYELGYDYRDEQRDQGHRADVAPDSLDYWINRTAH